jgi:hypothetical protein
MASQPPHDAPAANQAASADAGHLARRWAPPMR